MDGQTDGRVGIIHSYSVPNIVLGGLQLSP